MFAHLPSWRRTRVSDVRAWPLVFKLEGPSSNSNGMQMCCDVV